jgi:Flp pilus assembly protein TadG
MARPPLLLLLKSCRRGVTAVEFAVSAPILLAAVLGLGELGTATAQKVRLMSAARAGAQYAINNTTGTDAAITSAVKAAANLGPDPVTVTVTRSCGCDDGSTVSCSGGTCSSGSVREWVAVTASQTFNTGVLGTTYALSGQATLRVK